MMEPASQGRSIAIRTAEPADVPLILSFIRDLASYEHLTDQVIADERALRETLFGARPYAEVIIASLSDTAVGFALFFHNYSTFLAKPGIYLEDLYVRPEARGYGVGRHLLRWLARTALARHCGRLEWSVLDWNAPSIAFYEGLGAVAMDEWRTFRVTGDALTGLAER